MRIPTEPNLQIQYQFPAFFHQFKLPQFQMSPTQIYTPINHFHRTKHIQTLTLYPVPPNPKPRNKTARSKKIQPDPHHESKTNEDPTHHIAKSNNIQKRRRPLRRRRRLVHILISQQRRRLAHRVGELHQFIDRLHERSI